DGATQNDHHAEFLAKTIGIGVESVAGIGCCKSFGVGHLYWFPGRLWMTSCIGRGGAAAGGAGWAGAARRGAGGAARGPAQPSVQARPREARAVRAMVRWREAARAAYLRCRAAPDPPVLAAS